MGSDKVDSTGGLLEAAHVDARQPHRPVAARVAATAAIVVSALISVLLLGFLTGGVDVTAGGTVAVAQLAAGHHVALAIGPQEEQVPVRVLQRAALHARVGGSGRARLAAAAALGSLAATLHSSRHCQQRAALPANEQAVKGRRRRRALTTSGSSAEKSALEAGARHSSAK